MTKALITGIDGQDGSYLAELLLTKGYEVHGIVRRSAKPWANLAPFVDDLTLHYGDLTNATTVAAIVRDVQPDELYNLAGQSDVGVSFQNAEYTLDVNVLGVAHLLEAVRRFSPDTRFYQASSSEMFGRARAPQNEYSAFDPVSPYAISKRSAHELMGVYREAFGVFACAGILFNHESERRGTQFVTRKVTMAVARIACGLQFRLELWNKDSKRDWGYAPDYVKAMWMMLQHGDANDYVVGTGIQHTVEHLLWRAFDVLGMDWQEHTVISATDDRPIDPKDLCANPEFIFEQLGWYAETSFDEMICRMVKHDLKLAEQEKAMR